MAEYKVIPLGTLNRVEVSKDICPVNPLGSSAGYVRKYLAQAAQPSQIPNMQRFIGQVLYILKSPESGPAPSTISSALKATGVVADGPKLTQIIVRVPELHALLPIPAEGDMDAISLYPVFTAVDESVPLPEIDDLVYVDFKNKINLTEGIYLGTLKGSGTAQVGSGGGVGGGGGSGTGAEETFNETREFKPLNIPSNFTRIKDVRNLGTINDRIFKESEMKKFDTVVLHQTSDCRGGDKPRPRLAVHFFIDRSGTAWLQYDFEMYLATSHQFNRRSIGLEIEGYLSGVIGAPPRGKAKNLTFWSPAGASEERRTPQLIPPEQVEAAKQAIRYFCKHMQEKYGVRIKYVGTHRQTYNDKTSDPGQDIMDKIGNPIAKELGLYLFPGIIGTGHTNPEIWGGNSNEPYRSDFKATKASGWIKKYKEN